MCEEGKGGDAHTPAGDSGMGSPRLTRTSLPEPIRTRASPMRPPPMMMKGVLEAAKKRSGEWKTKRCAAEGGVVNGVVGVSDGCQLQVIVANKRAYNKP